MLRISNLTFSHRDKDIFNRTSVILPDGGVVAIIGDNGAGKTTLLRLLAGELKPDDGTLNIDGDLAYLPQDNRSSSRPESGGERTRHLLEQIFAQKHDILLLDEPTNNLDAETKNWLSTQLLACDSLTLVVSHDRDFIDQVAGYVLEIKDGQLTLYSGNYSVYAARLAEEHKQQASQYEKAHKAAAKVEERLHRARTHSDQTNHSHYNKARDESRLAFRAKRNHAQNTAGKIIRAAQTDLDRLRSVERPVERKTYQAKLSADFLRHRRLLRVDRLTKSYDNRELFESLSFEVYTGEQYRIIGKNGAGKTTLFRIILGDISPDNGSIILAPNLKLGYISQEVSGLDLDQSFLAQSEAQTTEIFQAASTMDLSPRDIQAPCGSLSRGQLTKLALLKVILSPVDLLILDEPTNHLDIRARENIENALADYPGAILLAAHDEHLAHRLKLTGEIALNITRTS